MPFVPRLTGQNMALVAVFAGLIALSTTPPEFSLASGVPISLQTLAVVLTGLVLGAWRGFAAVLLYVAVGLAGAPVYSDGASSWGAFVGPTGGYLWSFPIAAFVVGWIAERIRTSANGIVGFSALMGAGLISLPIVYAVGVPWLAFSLDLPVFTAGSPGEPTAIAWGLIPFVVGDFLKVVAAAAVASAIHRSFPHLLSATSVHFAASALADEARDAASAPREEAAAGANS